MGLIRAAVGAIGSTLHDQWKEVISCENMSNDILMVKKTTKNGTISKGSIVRVTEGQCVAIYQNGKVLDAVAEPGDYTYDESTVPSFFAGQFKAVFKEMWNRFTYNGATSNQQVVFFFNIKEIIGNKYGTATPVMYTDYSHPVPNGMTGTLDPLPVKVRCYGNYTFKITDPATFMKEIAGTADVYKKDALVMQIRSEVIDVLQTILNELGNSENKYPVLNLPSASPKIKELLNAKEYDGAVKRRGISITDIFIESIDLDEASDKYIKEYVLASNANMQQGTLVGAYADGIRDAAKNSGGAATGFMGIGMMNMTSNGMFGGAVNNATSNATFKPTANQNDSNQEKWKCKCGVENTGKFCSECGAKKEEKAKCPKCNTTVDSNEKFCHECGEKLGE